jgi:hypothetical protein
MKQDNAYLTAQVMESLTWTPKNVFAEAIGRDQTVLKNGVTWIAVHMVRANLGIAYAKMDGKEVFVRFVSAILGAQHTECAPMELVFAQTDGMENIAPLKDAHRTAMVMDNARQTMRWSGSACASQDGMEQDAIFIWNKTAPIVKIMTMMV